MVRKMRMRRRKRRKQKGGDDEGTGITRRRDFRSGVVEKQLKGNRGEGGFIL